MTDIFAALQPLFDIMLSMGATVFVPLMIFIVAVLLGVSFGKAFKGALLMACGYAGVFIVLGYLFGAVFPPAQAFIANTGASLTVIDMGWPLTAALSYATPVGTAILPTFLVVNIVLLIVGFTKTLDIDIWNYWHMAFTASMVDALGGGFTMGLVAGCLMGVVMLFLGDWNAEAVQEYYGIPGISLPHGEGQSVGIWGFALTKIYEMIPGLNSMKLDIDTVQEKFGVFGDPVTIGFILGIIIGALGGIEWTAILILGVDMAAVMAIFPRMLGLLTEGMVPLSQGIRDGLSKRFPGREIWMGLDLAVVIGHPAVVANILVMIPVVYILAIALSTVGLNQLIPYADIALVGGWPALANSMGSKDNLLYGVITSTLIATLALTVATIFAPVMTQIAITQGYEVPAGAVSISSVSAGMHMMFYAVIALFTFTVQSPSNQMLALLIAAGSVGAYLFSRDEPRKYAAELRKKR
jgi:PTS system galactitol-specific IIC component